MDETGREIGCMLDYLRSFVLGQALDTGVTGSDLVITAER